MDAGLQQREGGNVARMHRIAIGGTNVARSPLSQGDHVPELPEVEVTRMGGGARPCQDATIDGVRMGKPLRWPLQVAPQPGRGNAFQSVQQHWQIHAVAALARVLLVHLLCPGGSVRCATELGEAGVHDHFDLFTTRGVLRLTDPRRLGYGGVRAARQITAGAAVVGAFGRGAAGRCVCCPAYLRGAAWAQRQH